MKQEKMTKADVLWNILSKYNRFSSVVVRETGLAIGYTRADREVRKWAEKYFRVRKLTDEECILGGLWGKGRAKLAWYEPQINKFNS
jgi:hypothetical protein